MRRRSSGAGTPSTPAEETECTRVTRDSQSMHARGLETKWPVLSRKIASAMFSSPFLPGVPMRIHIPHPLSTIPRRTLSEEGIRLFSNSQLLTEDGMLSDVDIQM